MNPGTSKTGFRQVKIMKEFDLIRNKIIWKNNYIETSYLSNKMLYNSLLFNKIESSIGVDKWVTVLDIQEKPFVKPLYKLIK
jgi:hypothetical protein